MFPGVIRRVGLSIPKQWTSAAGCSSKIYKLPSDDLKAAKNVNEAPIVDNENVLTTRNKVQEKLRQSALITIPVERDLTAISGVPEEHIKSRRVRICLPSKNGMQSGTNNLDYWKIEFENRERWENPLMGWASTGDPLSNLHVEFNTKEEAIVHCEKNGWKWFIDGEEKPLIKRNKNYGVNFAWNKRTRVSTK